MQAETSQSVMQTAGNMRIRNVLLWGSLLVWFVYIFVGVWQLHQSNFVGTVIC